MSFIDFFALKQPKSKNLNRWELWAKLLSNRGLLFSQFRGPWREKVSELLCSCITPLQWSCPDYITKCALLFSIVRQCFVLKIK